MSNEFQTSNPKLDKQQYALLITKWKGSANTNGAKEDLNGSC
jgi:hypothetical protein